MIAFGKHELNQRAQCYPFSPFFLIESNCFFLIRLLHAYIVVG